MKYLKENSIKKGFTLIETLLVFIVISLIFIAIGRQFQRYQAARNLSMTSNAASSLASSAIGLFQKSCQEMYANIVYDQYGNVSSSSQIKQVICPLAAQASMSNLISTDYCQDIIIPNPWVPTNYDTVSESNIKSYTIQIFAGSNKAPQIWIGLPVSSAVIGKVTTASDANNKTVNASLQKYVAKLQPTQVVFNNKTVYVPGGGVSPNVSSDICVTTSGMPACFEWLINPLNWGTLASTVNNATAATELLAAYGTYTFAPGKQPTATTDQSCATYINSIIKFKMP